MTKISTCININCEYKAQEPNLECGICILNKAFNIAQPPPENPGYSIRPQFELQNNSYYPQPEINRAILTHQYYPLGTNISLGGSASVSGIEQELSPIPQPKKIKEPVKQKCELCKKKFCNLIKHQLLFHSSDIIFKCPESGCESDPFKRQDTLKEHVKLKHGKILIYGCIDNECGYTCPTLYKSISHFKLYHPLDKKSIHCTKCSASFDMVDGLIYHYQAHH